MLHGAAKESFSNLLGIILGERSPTSPALKILDGPQNAKQADPDNSLGR